MVPPFTAALLAISLAGAHAPTELSATATASVKILSPGGIAVISPLILPSIVVTSDGAAFATPTPALGTAGGGVAGNARLTVVGDTLETVSVDVPPSFAVVRAGGSESLTVDTVTHGDLAVAGSGVLLGGGMIGDSATSVDIGGKLALASADHLVPGPYDGLLVVVVQYN